MVSANDFLTSRGTATHDLLYDGTLSLMTQIGTSYQPYLVSGDTLATLFLDSDTVPTGIPPTSRYFLMSVWVDITVNPGGAYFFFDNNTTPGILVYAFSSGLVTFSDALISREDLLYYPYTATGLNYPGLNHLLVSCDTVGETYEAVLNGTVLTDVPFTPHVYSFTCDNSGGLYLIQPNAPSDWFTELWFDMPDSYISASDPSVIAKFYNSGDPVDPGADGSVPFGSQPVGYFTVRDAGSPTTSVTISGGLAISGVGDISTHSISGVQTTGGAGDSDADASADINWKRWKEWSAKKKLADARKPAPEPEPEAEPIPTVPAITPQLRQIVEFLSTSDAHNRPEVAKGLVHGVLRKRPRAHWDALLDHGRHMLMGDDRKSARNVAEALHQLKRDQIRR